MATVTLAWNTLVRVPLTYTADPNAADQDDIYAVLPETLKITSLTFSGGTANYHSHGGTSTRVDILGRKASDATWVLLASLPATTGEISFASLSVITVNNDTKSTPVDAIRLMAVPYQSTAMHLMANVGTLTLETTASVAAAGGGGGGGGAGNMFGTFLPGQTMLGGDQGDGAGGGGGSGLGNMLGAFVPGLTMLGGDAGGGAGGSAPPLQGGAQPMLAEISAAAAVTGAFQTFVWAVAGTPAGSCTVANAYLNSNWALAATTVNPTGLTRYGNTTYFINTDIAQGERKQIVNITEGTGTSSGMSSFGSTTYKKPLAGGPEEVAHSVGGSTGPTYSYSVNAGTGYYITRIALSNNGLKAIWEWQAEPASVISGLVYSPIGLHGSPVGDSTASGNISTHILRGSPLGFAENSADLSRQVRLAAQGVLTGSTVAGTLINTKVLEGAGAGEATVTGEAVLTYLSAGEATVTGDMGVHTLRSQPIQGTATVEGNLRRDLPYQGDSLASATVVGDLPTELVHAAEPIVGTATVRASVQFPAPLTGGTATGTSSVTGGAEVFTIAPTPIECQGTVTASLRYLDDIVRLSGAVAGEASIQADTRMRFRFGQQVIACSATVTADQITRVWFVDGAPAGDSTVTFDTITIHYPAPGPIVCGATVEAHATHDAKYGGLIQGEGTLAGQSSAVYLLPTATPQGTTEARGILYVRPQDFDPDRSNGSAAVLGQVLLTLAQMKGLSQGGRFENHMVNPYTGVTPWLDDRGIAKVSGYNDILAKGHMGVAFFFKGVSRAEASVEYIEAILLINDSGLIRGNSRLDARLDRISTEYQGRSNGFATVPWAFVDRPKDMQAHVNDAYAGVGKWYPGSEKWVPIWADYGGFRPFDDELQVPAHGEPGHIHLTGAPYTVERMNAQVKHVNTERRYVGKWDGTYEPIGPQDVPNLPQHPWFTDPERGWPNVAPGKLPGPMRRRLQLADPGQLGGWFVDNSGAGFRDKAMVAAIVGEARFDEPQSTVDMDLELKSSMKGMIVCDSSVVAFALLLSFRKLLATGNVTALRHLLREATGNTTKSDQTRMPITQADAELIRPARNTTALYV